MGITVDGTSIVIDNARLEIVNATEASGVAYLIITPDGGVGTLPFLAQGLPGAPTLFPTITYTEVDPAEPLPVPNPAVTLLDAGGAGLSAKYSLAFYGHKGDTGATGSPSIGGASDLATAPPLDSNAEKFTLVYRNSDSKWVPTAQKVGGMYVSGAISSTAHNSTSPRLLSSIAVPAQPFDWRPRPFAQCPVTGSADTRVDLIARLNDAAAGDQVGYSKGLSGVTPPPNILIPAPPAGTNVPGSYGLVSAGAAATVHLRAEQKAASNASWSTPASPDITYCVEVCPVL